MKPQDQRAVYQEILRHQGQLVWEGEPIETALTLVQHWWSTHETQPAWRTPEALGAYRRSV